MARRAITAAGRTYQISDDSAPRPEQLWWAVLRARVVDELSGKPPRSGIRVTTKTPRCVPRVASDGIVGLAARPRDVSTFLVTPGGLNAEVSVPGYLPRSLDAAIDAARRSLFGGAALGATSLTVTPNEVAPREQFVPGRGVMIEREAATDPEQFSLVSALPPPAADIVPITDPVDPGRTGVRQAAGVPIVLADQPLHLASVAVLRGRAVRPAGLNGSLAAIGIDGVWWDQAEVRAHNNPPHLPHLASFAAPLAFDHPAGTVTLCSLSPADAVTHRLQARVFSGGSELLISPWTSLNTAGGDVLELEETTSHERELVITAAFAVPPLASQPAVVPLRTPLAFPHGIATPVFRRNAPSSPAGNVAREAQRGDRVLFMSVPLANDGVLRLDEGSATRDELRFVRRLPTFASGVTVTNDGTSTTAGSFEFPPLARIAKVRIRARYNADPELPFTDLALDYDGKNRVDIQFI